MLERDVQNRIMLLIGTRPYLRIWRQSVGVATPYATVQAVIRLLERGDPAGALGLLSRARVIKFGVPGAADITGVFACGMRVEIEVKRPGGKQSAVQVRFETVMNSMSCLYVVVDSEESIEDALCKHLDACPECTDRKEWNQ
ncbi:MAG: hypothetical protein DRH30_03270 [Deltaproteobacteria bacterium]|nr:MAG: hypothetical protein DRH30_03270 [Deltaproteobacteria bacterium]